MAGLTWADDDGFDAGGRRVASVMQVVDVLSAGAVQGSGHGPGFLALDRYWEAYVRRGDEFELVLVDGAPGRWRQRDEATAAAESAYRTLAMSPADGDGVGEPEDAGPTDVRRRPLRTWFAGLWTFVRVCFRVYPPRRREPRG